MRRLNSGDPVVSLRIATSESWRDKASGERKERTEWHDVVIFNENLGKIAEQYLRKGSKVYVEGQLQNREWQDQQGNKRRSTEVVLQRFRGELTLLDSRGGGPGASIEDAGEGRAPLNSGALRRWSAGRRRRLRAAEAANMRASSTTTFRSDEDRIRGTRLF